MKKKKTTTDALEIMDREFFHGKPEQIAELEKMRADNAVARKICDQRTKAGLTQRKLASMIGTPEEPKPAKTSPLRVSKPGRTRR